MPDQPTDNLDEWAVLSREEFELWKTSIPKSREGAKTEEQTRALAGPGPPANPEGEHREAPLGSTQAAASQEEGSWEDRTKEVPLPHSAARAGLAALSELFQRPAVFIPIPSGRKEPTPPGWNGFSFEHTQSEHYQEMLLESWEAANLGVLLGPRSGRLFTININDEEAVEELVRDIPWLKDTTRSWAQRGCQFWLILEQGDYPTVDVIPLKRNGRVVGELRLGGDKGIQLLDRFPTTQSPVLYVNFELLEASSALRFDAMQREIGGNQDNIIVISVSDYLDVLGDNFSQYLALCAKDFARKAVILDPMWRILGSFDENKNSEVRQALAPLVRFSREAQASMLGAHHHAKGSPVGKEAIDRSSGAGAWHRDPSVIWTMTPHRSH